MIVDDLLKIMSTNHELDAKQSLRAYNELVAIVKSHGVNVFRSRNFRYKFGWNGKSIRIDTDAPDWASIKTETYMAHKTIQRCVLDLAHEFSHFLCASPSRRYLKEFGLGAGFSTSGYVKQVASDDVTTHEENMACLMAAIILNHLNMPTLQESELVNFVYSDSMGKCEWSGETDVADVRKYVARMIKWGIITKDLKPTFKARTVVED